MTPSGRDFIFVSEQNGAVLRPGGSAAGERGAGGGTHRRAGVAGGGGGSGREPQWGEDRYPPGGRAGAASGPLRPLPVPASACRSTCPRRGPAPRFHGDGGEAAAAVAARPPPGAGRLPLPGAAAPQGEGKVNGAAGMRPGFTASPAPAGPRLGGPGSLAKPGPGGTVSLRAWALRAESKAFLWGPHFSSSQLLFFSPYQLQQHKVTPRCVSESEGSLSFGCSVSKLLLLIKTQALE